MAGSSEHSSHELEYRTVAEAMPSLFFSCVEEKIEKSKAHWSVLADVRSSECMAEGGDAGEAELSNVEEFLELQRHPIWGGFFRIFGDNVKGRRARSGSLEVGEKFAEGAQAEVFHARVTWDDPRNMEMDVEDGIEYVLKVFKKGTYLKELKAQLPDGLLQADAEEKKHCGSTAKRIPKLASFVVCGTLLEDGRFAFLMEKEYSDLRTLIECNMKLRGGEVCGPFSSEEAELMMFQVALGVNWLHNHGIVHRDLKASNVLVLQRSTFNWSKWECFVADYECSVGVVGTGFFRAPEILQACMAKRTRERPEVFSTVADVYSYGMTCYEILTGKLPFEDHPLIDDKPLLMDLVINQGLRPIVPESVEEWVVDLLRRCWEHDPTERPTSEEILNLLIANSSMVRRLENINKEEHGENYRNWWQSEIVE